MVWNQSSSFLHFSYSIYIHAYVCIMQQRLAIKNQKKRVYIYIERKKTGGGTLVERQSKASSER